MEDIIALGKPWHLLLIKAWMVMSLLMLLGSQASRTIISCVDAKQTVSLIPRLIVPQRTGDLILLAMDYGSTFYIFGRMMVRCNPTSKVPINAINNK